MIDSLSKSIQSEERAIAVRKEKIERLRNEIKDKEVIVDNLIEENKDSELIILAYRQFILQEKQQADQENLETDSMREKLTNDVKA